MDLILIDKSEIPNWLKRSELYKNMNEDENIVLPQKYIIECFKIINNIDEYILMFETMRFFMLVDKPKFFPNSFKKFTLENKILILDYCSDYDISKYEIVKFILDDDLCYINSFIELSNENVEIFLKVFDYYENNNIIITQKMIYFMNYYQDIIEDSIINKYERWKSIFNSNKFTFEVEMKRGFPYFTIKNNKIVVYKTRFNLNNYKNWEFYKIKEDDQIIVKNDIIIFTLGGLCYEISLNFYNSENIKNKLINIKY
jgi:hypothetical protein